MAVLLKSPVFFELETKKSRFLTWVEPVESSLQAKSRIAEIKQKYSDARHVCFAFYVEGSSGMSDDGEPSGTASKPMFNVLQHKGLVNILAVVVRYFGGIKLGAGGLSRAYGGAVSQALEHAEYLKFERKKQLHLNFPFSLENDTRRICTQFDLTLSEVTYSIEVSASVEVVESQLEDVIDAFQAMAPGNPDLDVQVEN